MVIVLFKQDDRFCCDLLLPIQKLIRFTVVSGRAVKNKEIMILLIFISWYCTTHQPAHRLMRFFLFNYELKSHAAVLFD